MPTSQPVLKLDELKAEVHRLFFPERDAYRDMVGLELEVWPFRATAARANTLVPFFQDDGQGLIQLLQRFQEDIPELAYEPTADGAHRFLLGSGQLTFEPGGQLEFSGSPKETLAEAIQELFEVIETLRCKLKTHDIWLFHSGLNPWYSIDEVGLQLRKQRYIHMNDYFRSIGPYGQKMMRLSTSLQVNLDAGDPETAQRRWLAANLLAPVFTAIFANSPFVDGKPSGYYSFRSHIWQNLDPSRTGFQPGFLAETYQPCPVEQYFRFALEARCMKLPDHRGDMVFDGRSKTFGQWLEQPEHGLFPDQSDWEDHLSTLFPEVRARGFFEFRYLDAQSKVWCSAPGILLTQLIYGDEPREAVIQMLEPYRRTLPAMLAAAAKQALTDSEIAGLAKRVFSLALAEAERHEPEAIAGLAEAFYRRYTSLGRNPAADLIDLNGGALFTPAQYRDFERRQVAEAGEFLQIICEYT